MSSSAFAQQPLKITNKPTDKVKFCNAGGQKFAIKSAADQETCDQLKKPNPKSHAPAPSEPLASPNPISAPPTGN